MPSSVLHLRVCDKLLDCISEKYHADFAVGNIAPDCGKPVPGTKSYDPPRHITHFTDLPQRWNTKTHPDRFFNEYVKDEQDMQKLVFKLGYYVHLAVDTAYIEKFFERFHEMYGEAFDLDMRRKLKKSDQHYLDLLYVSQHSDFRPKLILGSIGGYVNRCLDYYSPDAITERLIQIKHTELSGEVPPKPDTLYVTEEDCESFVSFCADSVRDVIVRELERIKSGNIV